MAAPSDTWVVPPSGPALGVAFQRAANPGGFLKLICFISPFPPYHPTTTPTTPVSRVPICLPPFFLHAATPGGKASQPTSFPCQKPFEGKSQVEQGGKTRDGKNDSLWLLLSTWHISPLQAVPNRLFFLYYFTLPPCHTLACRAPSLLPYSRSLPVTPNFLRYEPIWQGTPCPGITGLVDIIVGLNRNWGRFCLWIRTITRARRRQCI